MSEEGKAVNPAQMYSKGNEAFVADDYENAIQLYTAALGQDPLYADCMVARAHAYIKKDRYQEAKKDADKAIDILRSTEEGKGSMVLAKAFLRSGVASFHIGRYREAKNCFSEGQKLGEEPGLKQWMSWCDEKIAKFGDVAPGVADTSPAAKKSSEKSSDILSLSSSSITAASKQPPNQQNKDSDGDKQKDLGVKTSEAPASVQNTQMPTPTIKHDWYQTETNVVIEVRLKKMKNEDVTVEISESALSVTAKLPSGSDYSLELDLAHPVVADQSFHRVMSTKIEVKLRKKEGVRWEALEGEGVVPLAVPQAGAAAAAPKTVTVPYSSGKNWDRVAVDLEKELGDDKAEGEAALNEMFQKIYADSSDETKRAMNKSFSESGGTVLSTNWNEIGKEKTEVKAPDGMEWKQWD